MLPVFLTILWLVGVGAVAYYIIIRTSDGRRAAPLAVAFAVAFLLGSVAHPTRMITSALHGSITAEGQGAPAVTATAGTVSLPASSRLDALKNGGPATTAVIDSVRYVAPGTQTPAPVADSQFPASGAVAVIGWAADDGKVPGSGVFLIVDGKTRYEGSVNTYGVARPDVATALKNPRLVNTGYTVQLPLDALSAGQHALQVAVIKPDGKTFLVIPKPVEIVVSNK